jgi:hypothetical protein
MFSFGLAPIASDEDQRQRARAEPRAGAAISES